MLPECLDPLPIMAARRVMEANHPMNIYRKAIQNDTSLFLFSPTLTRVNSMFKGQICCRKWKVRDHSLMQPAARLLG